MTVRLSLVGIATRDMAASLAFYRLLGLEIPAEADSESHVELELDGVRFGWDSVDVLREVYGGWEEAKGHRVELAFACGDAAGVDTVYARVVEAGHRGHREPWDAFWGQRYAIVEDPDGNLISLFA